MRALTVRREQWRHVARPVRKQGASKWDRGRSGEGASDRGQGRINMEWGNRLGLHVLIMDRSLPLSLSSFSIARSLSTSPPLPFARSLFPHGSHYMPPLLPPYRESSHEFPTPQPFLTLLSSPTRGRRSKNKMTGVRVSGSVTVEALLISLDPEVFLTRASSPQDAWLGRCMPGSMYACMHVRADT